VWVASGGQFLAAGWDDGVFLAARAGLTVGLLPPLRDLDRVEDLRGRARRRRAGPRPATRAVVAELLAAPPRAAAG
jgi:hypothetical protein